MNYLSVYTELVNNVQNIKLLFSLNNRRYNMCRSPADPVGKTLKRIGVSVQKSIKKEGDLGGKEAEKQEALNDIPVALFYPNGEMVDSELANQVAWKESNVLNIGDSRFLVEENTPLVDNAKIPSVIMAGFPVVPVVKLKFADRENSLFKWFKSRADGSNPSSTQVEEKEASWIEIGQGFIYIPKIADIGCFLKMSCKAAGGVGKTAHTWFDVTSTCEVTPGPGDTPYDKRHLSTAKPTSDPRIFRFISYNILADCYIEDETFRNTWFGYCPKYCLESDYRQQLVLKEIEGYNGDIICLQECGRRLFENHLNPMMTSLGYGGSVKYKSGVMPEGGAIFFRKSKFTLIKQDNFLLSESFTNDACNNELLKRVQEAKFFYEKLMSRTTVGQIIILQSVQCPQNYICVVNVHLYFNPDTPFIRNLQTMIMLNVLKKTMENLDLELKQNDGGRHQVGVVFCGDLNSLPDSGVVQLLSSGELPDSHPDWNLPGEKPEHNHLEMMPYSHKFGLQNCCGFPEYTNYTEGFIGLLDYIFSSKKFFDVESNIPIPSTEEVQLYTALPSPVLPSDHVALVCDLKWK
ncbi:2',5'-phosphodiesterase 12-like [Dendronephthya gigantea]|uniref:2',5'-phosphodiesterase 12-like n=1 Tax=Dendronephthya gigantea TaxID=151771 RepID=UPI001069E62F|nr:2',5'-phosphodiesterase 12-like [Dendronephthya gigantea]